MNIAYQRALLLVQLSRYTDAELSLRHALMLDPSDARTHAMLAVCLVPQGKYPAARDAAEVAIQTDPKLAFAYYALAVTLLRDTKFESERTPIVATAVTMESSTRLELAEQTIRTAIRLDPENANYHSLLATVLLDRGDGEQAVDEARIALSFDSDQADALKIITVAAGYLGVSEKEISTSTASMTTTPTDPIEQAIYGAALLRAGQRDRAIPLLEEAISHEPDHPYVGRQYLEGMRSVSRIHALGLRTRHQSALVANPFAAFYSIALTLLVGIGFVLAMVVAQKLRISPLCELIVLTGTMLPSYMLVTLRAWIDFRLQFNARIVRLLTRKEIWQANAVVWAGALAVLAQVIPIGQLAGHTIAGVLAFSALALAATIYFVVVTRRNLRFQFNQPA